MQSQKWQNDLCSFQRQTIQYYSNPSLCPNEWCWRSWNWTVWWRPLRTNAPLKRCLFHYGELECKSMKSRATWSNRQIGLGIQKVAGQMLTEFCQKYALVIANILFQQHEIYTWTSPDGQHWNKIDDILCSQRFRSSIQSAKARLGADDDSNPELLITKVRLKSKKVGKNTPDGQRWNKIDDILCS